MESSINSRFTFNYSQPSEYRLSHDSVFLAQKIFNYMAEVDLKNKTALDICAGCGVIGMDFLFLRRQAGLTVPHLFDFLEVQGIYQDHFIENTVRLGMIDCKLNFYNLNYNELQSVEFAGQYDLIICNPPYFNVKQGRLSASTFKNRCRFFIDSDLKSLILGIYLSLKKTGRCYLLLRDLQEHGLSVIDEVRKLGEGRLQVEVKENIRRAFILNILRI